jgi:hypothetical protein
MEILNIASGTRKSDTNVWFARASYKQRRQMIRRDNPRANAGRRTLLAVPPSALPKRNQPPTLFVPQHQANTREALR